MMSKKKIILITGVTFIIGSALIIHFIKNSYCKVLSINKLNYSVNIKILKFIL